MPQNQPRKKALVIAVSDYNKLDKLDFCKTNGEEISKLLMSLGYEIPQQCRLVGKVSYDIMRRAMIAFFRDNDTKSDDTMLFYFTGHGDIPTKGGKFFCTSEYDTRLPEQDGIQFGFLTDMMGVCNALKKVAIIDCCFSGAVASGVVGMSATKEADARAANVGRTELGNEYKYSSGYAVLASSLGTHESFPHPTKPYSAFSYFVIEGLKGNAIGDDGKITTSTLYEYVHRQFSSSDLLKEQQPVENTSVAGKILLAEYPDLAPTRPEESIEKQLILLLKEGNLEQYQILKKQNPERILDLDGFAFPENVELHGIDLRWASLAGVDFSSKDLKNALLTYADLTGSDLTEANLTGANFEHCKLIEANLSNANLANSDLKSCDLTGADCTGANFSKSKNFRTAVIDDQTILRNAIFNGTDLSSSSFEGNLSGAKFIDARLYDVTFDGSDLRGADFSRATASGARFLGCKLTETNFIGSNMEHANFSGGPNHLRTNFQGAILAEARFTDLKFTDANFSNVELMKADFVRLTLDKPNFNGARFGATGFRLVKLFNAITSNSYFSEEEKNGKTTITRIVG